MTLTHGLLAFVAGFVPTLLVGFTVPLWIDPVCRFIRRPINSLRVRLSRDPVYRLRPGRMVQSTLRRENGQPFLHVLFARTGKTIYLASALLDPVDPLT